jgi:tol-pal system protein YbgF
MTRTLWALLAASVLLAACETPHPEQDPAYLKATAVEARVDVLERQTAAILELHRQLESAQSEQRTLKGQVEELQHSLASGERRERDLYRDLSDRITGLDGKVRELEKQVGQLQSAGPQPAAATAASASAATPGPAAVAVTDRDVYQSALERLNGRDYAGAEKAFQDFLLAYPQSSLADNAQYWLGEAYYVERRFTEALASFQKVLKDHPESRKVPDALLKIGYTYQELKRYREARETLARLIKSYPDARVAPDARERLKQIPGHR